MVYVLLALTALEYLECAALAASLLQGPYSQHDHLPYREGYVQIRQFDKGQLLVHVT